MIIKKILINKNLKLLTIHKITNIVYRQLQTTNLILYHKTANNDSLTEFFTLFPSNRYSHRLVWRCRKEYLKETNSAKTEF